VSCSLTENFILPLQAAGFDPHLKTAWLAEGVLFYLDQKAVSSILRLSAESSASDSFFAADLNGRIILERPELKSYLDWLDSQGKEPPFCTDQPEELFQSNGWERVDVEQLGEERANFGRFPLMPEYSAECRAATMFVTGEKMKANGMK